MSIDRELNLLGPLVGIDYLHMENGVWWCELSLPTDRYEQAMASGSGPTRDDAFTAAVARAFSLRRKEVAA